MKKIYHAFLPAIIFLNFGAAPVKNDFSPAWWCRGAHAQTIAGSLSRSDEKVSLERERIQTFDGDFFDADWLAGKKSEPMVVILHGLGSSSDAPYIQTFLKQIRDLEWQSVIVSARGTFGPNHLPIMDHSGRTEDLNQIVQTIIQRNQANSIFLVGYSAGGNKVLKWLGEKSTTIPSQVKKAVVVSAACDLAKTVNNLDHGFDRALYTRRMLDHLKTQALEKEKAFPGILNVEKIKSATSFREYDREVTAKLGGFKDENDFWSQASAAAYLKGIKRPVLMIHAKNDPFLHGDELPLEEIERSAYLHLLLTKDGGHLGFVNGIKILKAGDWLEATILSYLKAQAQ